MSAIAPTQPATSPAVAPGVPAPSSFPASPKLYRFTVDQYARMGEAGILTEDDRVELVEGLIYRKIVNLVERQVGVYSGPGPNGYAARVDYKPGDAVPAMIDGQLVGQVAVDDILP
jgi:hypothetical protein